MTSNDFNPDGENRRRPVTARELRKAKEARERQEMGLTEKTEAGEREPEAEVTEKEVPKPENTVFEAGPNPTSPPPVQDAEVLNALQEELERAKEEANRWKKEADENYEGLLRARADLENFRRRTRKDQQELAKYAAAPLVESLLPVIDNLERALDAGAKSEEAEALHKGVEMISRQLLQTLEEHGLSPIEAEGKEFNPHEHNAVMQVEADGVESGMVVEELQKGYRFKERVIRPSMVKVST
ncbi:nucleotide exchange factor GrpE [Kroppenstedtia eburnea]|uniref:Protein GrpE n=1 Tax=Kroppenstedtia eburnea TaxID=714067 RepID=A0A1N7KYL5_9BACL|nr:nucleotide exchange factor GrpE [Kroppenstedtia eburnea]EGK12657.1 heat shock protein GrpE [Desmospora sp. 8437]QKI82745.1 nucleotide exchange factor GrpE [Kroppenstedtia eburnea]SIS66732.1 molecular chaperone GrpE [Kroppenstedtia eburnea]